MTRGFSFHSGQTEKRRCGKYSIVYNYSRVAAKASIIINLSAYFFRRYYWKRELQNFVIRFNPLWSSANIYFYFSYVCVCVCVYPVLLKKLQFFPWSNFFVPALRRIRTTKKKHFFGVCWITFKEITGIEIRIFSAWFSTNKYISMCVCCVPEWTWWQKWNKQEWDNKANASKCMLIRLTMKKKLRYYLQ